MLEELSRTVADLQNDMVRLQKEVRDNAGSMSSVRRLMAVLDDASRKASEQQGALEDRIAKIEHNQDSSARTVVNSLESFSSRLTELGEELVSWPPAPEVKAAMENFRQLSGNCDSVARQTHHLHSLVEQFRVEMSNKLKQYQTDLRAVIDLSCKHGQEYRSNVDAVKSGFDEHREMYKRDIAGMKMMIESKKQHGNYDTDEIRCVLDETRHQGRENRREIDGLKATVHLLQHGADYALHDCPSNWSESQLSSWLVTQGLPTEVAHIFQAHLVNGLVGVELTREDLVSMGISDPFQQRRILRELQKLFRSSLQVERAAVPALVSNCVQQPSAPSRPQSARSQRPQSARSQRPQSVSGKRSRPPSATSRAPCATCQDLACTALSSGFPTTMKNAAIVVRPTPMDAASPILTPSQPRQPHAPHTARSIGTPLRSPPTYVQDGGLQQRSLRDLNDAMLPAPRDTNTSQASGDTLSQLEALRRRCEEREEAENRANLPAESSATSQLFNLMDTNRDGVITREEFTQSLAAT